MKRTASTFAFQMGARIRKCRLGVRMTQADLGRMLGVSQQQIGHYEAGINEVPAARTFDLCRILNVPLSSIIPGERPPPEPGHLGSELL
ncbi:helix-turn-helix domain-containing protein [Bradyrhizobium guangxiense]|uniref:helix-turn-helix domain-containing protein n=1 Tax=Bradyrhizobium guangxiense TaxID=1325115 RepID=UPI001008E122